MEGKRMGGGYCPRCLKSKANCTCIADSLKGSIDLSLVENGQLIKECIKRHIYIEKGENNTDSKSKEAIILLARYKVAWNKLKDFVEALQEGHKNQYAYSNQYIDYIDDEMVELEEKYLTD